MKAEFICAHNIDHLKTMQTNSVDSIVTDPPYELGFMGKSWDSTGIAYDISLWGECLRVLKPGGHLLSFGGSRTYHRMACAIEDAGFEIRDQIMWIYGTGFPKSHNLSGEFEGWGSALKPAHEPIVMARKPIEGTISSNMIAHKVGGLNINACRIPGDAWKWGTQTDIKGAQYNNARPSGGHIYAKNITGGQQGRWPANVIHDGSGQVLLHFPDAKGQLGNLKGSQKPKISKGIYGSYRVTKAHTPRVDANKSAARFFYCAKASSEERNKGLDLLPKKTSGMVSNTSGQHITRRDGGAPPDRANHHPTVKPIALIRYLIRLVAPKGGLILDPFSGSGSHAIAAAMEDCSSINIDINPEYIEIGKNRYTSWIKP